VPLSRPNYSRALIARAVTSFHQLIQTSDGSDAQDRVRSEWRWTLSLKSLLPATAGAHILSATPARRFGKLVDLEEPPHASLVLWKQAVPERQVDGLAR
jgi:hypothetical protein